MSYIVYKEVPKKLSSMKLLVASNSNVFLFLCKPLLLNLNTTVPWKSKNIIIKIQKYIFINILLHPIHTVRKTFYLIIYMDILINNAPRSRLPGT